MGAEGEGEQNHGRLRGRRVLHSLAHAKKNHRLSQKQPTRAEGEGKRKSVLHDVGGKISLCFKWGKKKGVQADAGLCEICRKRITWIKVGGEEKGKSPIVL